MRHSNPGQAYRMVPVALAVALATLPVTASADDGPWQIRLAVVSMNPGGSSVVVPGTGEEFSYDSGSGVGFALDLEYRVSRRLGIDFGVISASPSINATVGAQPLSVSASGDLRVTPVFAALDIHLISDRRVDVFIGPMLAYVRYNSFDLVAGPGLREEFEGGSDFAVGGVLGLDVGLGGGGWSLNAAIRYLDTTLETSPNEGGDVGVTDIDPTIFSIGVGYRF
jgi:outer membrane protein W